MATLVHPLPPNVDVFFWFKMVKDIVLFDLGHVLRKILIHNVAGPKMIYVSKGRVHVRGKVPVSPTAFQLFKFRLQKDRLTDKVVTHIFNHFNTQKFLKSYQFIFCKSIDIIISNSLFEILWEK